MNKQIFVLHFIPQTGVGQHTAHPSMKASLDDLAVKVGALDDESKKIARMLLNDGGSRDVGHHGMNSKSQTRTMYGKLGLGNVTIAESKL